MATEAELIAIRNAGIAATAELQKIERERERAKNLRRVGETLKVRNSFGNANDEGWWEWMILTSVSECGSLYGFQFSRDIHGRVTISPDQYYMEQLGWQPCSATELVCAWAAILASLPSPDPRAAVQR